MSKKRRNKSTVRNDGFKQDGFIDAFIKSGIRQYMKNNDFYGSSVPLSDMQLQRLWKNALARRISSLPAEAALKNGFEVDGDKEEVVIPALEKIGATDKLIEALTWARHYGRSCIFMITDDGGTEEDPINYQRLRSIKKLQVYDGSCIQDDLSGMLINDDPLDPNFGNTEWYQITPPRSGRTLYIHHSRLLVFDGDMLPEHERILRNGAGLSCLDGIIKAINRCETAQSTGLNALERLSTSLIKFENLAAMLQNDEGTELVQKRLDIIDMARNILNTIALSDKDDYQVFNIPMTGIPNLLDSFGLYICGLTGIPFTVLFGRSPAGLNSTGAGDLENYYNMVSGIQRRQLKPQLEKLIRTLMLCNEGPTNGKEIKDWSIKFNALWVPTQKEQAETEKLQAEKQRIEVETIALLKNAQLMDDSEARKYLKENTDYPISKSPLNLEDIDPDVDDVLNGNE